MEVGQKGLWNSRSISRSVAGLILAHMCARLWPQSALWPWKARIRPCGKAAVPGIVREGVVPGGRGPKGASGRARPHQLLFPHSWTKFCRPLVLTETVPPSASCRSGRCKPDRQDTRSWWRSSARIRVLFSRQGRTRGRPADSSARSTSAPPRPVGRFAGCEVVSGSTLPFQPPFARSAGSESSSAWLIASSTMNREPLWTSQNTGAARVRLRM